MGQSILSMLQCEFGRKLLAASSTGNFFTCNHCDTDLDEVVGEEIGVKLRKIHFFELFYLMKGWPHWYSLDLLVLFHIFFPFQRIFWVSHIRRKIYLKKLTQHRVHIRHRIYSIIGKMYKNQYRSKPKSGVVFCFQMVYMCPHCVGSIKSHTVQTDRVP